ncbi:thioesterase domain-containing protein [Nonomuraea sp. NPDC049607]|uniref:thioesterase II family protein n=1 Tax=unclassified Nonomuraea TaxID=2593643 RepID=UPI00343711C7
MTRISIIKHERSPAPETRLFCFPHIAGGPAMFASWAEALPPEIELCVPLLPGRERSFGRAPFTDIEDLCAALHEAVGPAMDIPSVFFGDCLGALVAFRLAQRLQAAGKTGPRMLIVQGVGAPQTLAETEMGYPPSDAATGELVDYLKRAGDTDSALLDDPDWVEILEPALRGDLAIAESFRHHAAPPLTVPISVVVRDQARATIADFSLWAGLTDSEFTLRVLPPGPREWERTAAAVGRQISRTS